MNRFLVLLMVLVSTVYLADAQNGYWVYVSSSDATDQTGIGIYNWNPKIPKLKKAGGTTAVASSSYLTIDDKNDRLYSINGDGIQSFKVNKKTGALLYLNEVEHVGKGPCYLSMSSDNNFLLVAYYVSGSVASYRIAENGYVGELISHIQHDGSSVNKERQESAHAHMILAAPQNGLVYVTDLGMDKIFTYLLSEEGKLNEMPQCITDVSPGYGPRHFTFHPSSKYLFVLAELTGHVLSYRYDPLDGLTDKINEVSILPDGFDEFNKSADIHISRDGLFLYASNRGDNSIAICQINQKTGALTLVDILDCGGDWPRAFEVDPSGRFLLVANKRSDQISVMTIDNMTGLYKKAFDLPVVKGPQCVKFLPK